MPFSNYGDMPSSNYGYGSSGGKWGQAASNFMQAFGAVRKMPLEDQQVAAAQQEGQLRALQIKKAQMDLANTQDEKNYMQESVSQPDFDPTGGAGIPDQTAALATQPVDPNAPSLLGPDPLGLGNTPEGAAPVPQQNPGGFRGYLNAIQNTPAPAKAPLQVNIDPATMRELQTKANAGDPMAKATLATMQSGAVNVQPEGTPAQTAALTATDTGSLPPGISALADKLSILKGNGTPDNPDVDTTSPTLDQSLFEPIARPNITRAQMPDAMAQLANRKLQNGDFNGPLAFNKEMREEMDKTMQAAAAILKQDPSGQTLQAMTPALQKMYPGMAQMFSNLTYNPNTKEIWTEVRNPDDNSFLGWMSADASGRSKKFVPIPKEAKAASAPPMKEFEMDKSGNPTPGRKSWFTLNKDGTPNTYSGPAGTTESVINPPVRNQATVGDLKSAHDMAAQGIKNRMLLEMTPEEQMSTAGLDPNTMVAALLAGKLKSLPADRKAAYMKEFQDNDAYYNGQMNTVLGRKGVTTPPPTPGTSLKSTQGVTLGQIWDQISNQPTTKGAMDYLTNTYGYNQAQAGDLVRRGHELGHY